MDRTWRWARNSAVFLSFLAFFSQSCFEKALAEGFATVDFSILLAFHPQMARYDFSVKRFLLPELNLSDPNQIKKIQDAKNGVVSNPRHLESEKTRLSSFYLSSEESDKKLIQIFEEIDGVLSELSKERGNAAILDRSFLAPPAPFPGLSTPAAVVDCSSADLFSQMLNFDFSVPENFSGPPGQNERMRQGIEARFQDSFKKYTSLNPAFRSLVMNSRGRLFLTGGEDLTAGALSKIFESHGIRLEIRIRLLQLISQL
ncbi:hypothetical protein HYY75_03180 [bacterium]|nr:hypothetical protein [bacterium]